MLRYCIKKRNKHSLILSLYLWKTFFCFFFKYTCIHLLFKPRFVWCYLMLLQEDPCFSFVVSFEKSIEEILSHNFSWSRFISIFCILTRLWICEPGCCDSFSFGSSLTWRFHSPWTHKPEFTCHCYVQRLDWFIFRCKYGSGATTS